jgi:hypothetical protein
LTVDYGEDVRVVEDELEVEVAKVISFDVIPSRETVQKDHYHLKVARQFDKQRDDRQRQAIIGRNEKQAPILWLVEDVGYESGAYAIDP